MRRMSWFALFMFVVLAAPVMAQFGRITDTLKKTKDVADASKPWTKEQEEAVGEASAAKVIHLFGWYENPAMQRYVNLVGSTVARQAGRQDITYHFGILETDVVNAMAMPGGFIFITRGALANLSSEAELAGVLAHEVAHVDNRHLEKEIRAKNLTKIGVQTASEQAGAHGGVGGAWASWAISLAGPVVETALTSKYSRDKESEADKKGMDYAAKAGYNPAGLRDFLALLAKANEDPDNGKALSSWTDTHPPFTDRVSTLTSLLSKYQDNGQALPERYVRHVNAKTFAGAGLAQVSMSSAMAGGSPRPGAAANCALPAVGGPEYEGVVSKGSILLIGGQKLPEGARVKIRPQ